MQRVLTCTPKGELEGQVPWASTFSSASHVHFCVCVWRVFRHEDLLFNTALIRSHCTHGHRHWDWCLNKAH